MIIDSHCHLNYEPMINNLEQVIKRANLAGINYMLTISTEDKSFNSILEIVAKYKSVYGTYGIHPHEAKLHNTIKSINIIERINKNKKIIGIGETGLDFFYNHSDEKSQIMLFEEHIKAAQETGIPLIVHTRSAEEKTFEILKRFNNEKELNILIHCFTGSRDFAFKLLDIGSYISASGIITFKKSKELANTFFDIPNNKILVETDSPYLSPEPLRGKSNEPGNIIHTLKFLSKLKKIKYEDLSNITSENFFKLFGKLN